MIRRVMYEEIIRRIVYLRKIIRFILLEEKIIWNVGVSVDNNELRSIV
jgi:hypothetical protein